MSVYYLQGQSNSGNTNGLTGYYYPLYTDESLISGSYHSHTFTGLANEVFYMPVNEVNHAVLNAPTSSYYGNHMYQEYATYNLTNTVISYTNISTAQSQPVIAIASNGRDFDPFGNNAANTESLRVEELIPDQLREGSENFVSLIKDYYNHLNSEGLPTYETNRIIDEHDIDKVSIKYLDGIQGEIAKNIPDSTVIDRVSLYKKIIQYYRLKGSEESITTFFRLFFDEIIEVSYPREKLFELSSGDWRKKNEEFTRTITASITREDLGTEYNWTPFQIKNVAGNVTGTGNIISVEEVVLYDTSPLIDSLVFDLNSTKNLNSINETWDSVKLNKTIRGYFRQGTSFNQLDNLVKFNGTSSFVDFGDIGVNAEIPLDTEEHSFVIRAFPRFSKENTEIQPLFSLAKDYKSLHSHELFFNKTTNKIGRSFIDTGEPRIALHTDAESYVFSNFIDQTSVGLSSLQSDEAEHMSSFLSPLGNTYNGRWQKTLINFNGRNVYVHATDPVLSTFTADDLKFYQFDGDSFDGPNNLQVGQSIYGENLNDFSGVNALSEDGFVLAVGSSKNDGGGNNSGSVRVYSLANAILTAQTLTSGGETILGLKNVPADITTIPVGTVITGAGLPELGASDQFITTNTAQRSANANLQFAIKGAKISTTLTPGQSLRIGSGVNTWLQLGSDIDGDDAGDLLGSDISLNAAGNVLAIGAPHNQGAEVTHDGLPYPDRRGEVKIFNLVGSTWSLKGSAIVGGIEDSKLGANVSLNGVGDRVAISSGANPNQDFDIGTQEDEGILLEDFNGFGTTHYQDINFSGDESGITISGSAFNVLNRTYTKVSDTSWTNTASSSNKTLAFSNVSGLTTYGPSEIIDGQEYEIVTLGTTNWTTYGADATPAYGEIFTAANSVNNDITTGTVKHRPKVWHLDDLSGPYVRYVDANIDTYHESGAAKGSNRQGAVAAADIIKLNWMNYATGTSADNTFTSDGTTATVTGGRAFNTASTHIVVSGVSHQYDGLFQISSITSTTITYLRSGPVLTSNSFSLETGITPQFGAIDGGKTVGLRIPDRVANEVGVYEYSGSAWSQVGVNITELGNDPLAGNTVRLSDDGRTLLIGTHKIDSFGVSVMVVRAYYNKATTTEWNQLGEDVTFISADDKNQIPLSLSNDGTKFAVGILGGVAQESFNGQVETYSFKPSLGWVKFGQTLNGENVGDAFGSSINLDTKGNTIAIGSPNNDENGDESGKVQVFSYSSGSGGWEKVGSDINGFGATSNAGTSVSINGTGTRVIVGSQGDDQTGENRGKVEAYQVAIKATIGSFLHSEKNPLAAQSRFTIKSKDKNVYYTDWYSNSSFTNKNPYDVGIKWNKGNKQGDVSLPVLPHCEYTKRNNGHIFTLHNRGYLSIFYKHNGTYTPWQDITIGDTTVYGESRLWDILDYAVDKTHLILLDRPVNGASRLVIFKVDEYNRYNFYQTVSLNLPATHLGSADFAHIKFNNSQIVVGTHTFNNVDIAQVIQIYSVGTDNLWSSKEYLTLPSTYVTPTTPDLEFNINKNIIDGKWTSTDSLVRFESSVIRKGVLSDTGIVFDKSYATLGSGLGFNIADNFALSLRFKPGKLFSSANNILTIGNVTLRVVSNSLTAKKELQIVSQASGKTDYPVFLDKSDRNVILDNNPLEIFSDEYFNSEIVRDEWNNLTVEFTTNGQNIITGLRYSLNGFRRSKSIPLISNSPVHGITSTSQFTLHNNIAFAHVSFYNKELTHVEFDSLERNLSSNYSATITTGINSLLDGGKFDLSETGTIISKVTDCGIHIWEKISKAGWKNYYNTLTSITDASDSYITHNGSRLYSFRFFGDDLLIVNGGVNNAKQFVDQYSTSTVYNKAQHNSRAKLYYIKSQFETSKSSWKLEREFSPTITFSQSNEDNFRVGLNYGVDIIVDNANDSFAISLEPDSVNKTLNGPNSQFFTVVSNTTVKYDVWKKVSDNSIRSIPFIRPTEGFAEVNSYSGRLNSSAVLKIVDRSPSYSAILAFPDIIHTTSIEKPMIQYKYETSNPIGYRKTNSTYNSDFVGSTNPSLAVYSNTKAVKINEFSVIMVKGKADRYNGYVEISLDGSAFERIIEGNTIRHLIVSPQANIVLGRNGSGYYNGEISHSQYYTNVISDYSRDQIITFLNNNVKRFYRILFDEIKGTAIGATQINSLPLANTTFILGDLDGHAFNSFLLFDAPEYKLSPEINTAIRLTVDYGDSVGSNETVYWGDGRLNQVLNSSPVFHSYTLDYLGEYFDQKGRASGQMRIQDSVFWQKFSYNIRSGLKVDDWESTFLNLVHPAGLRFFASVILLVIRDNHWYGPKFIQFDANTRQNNSILKVEDRFLSPFRTTQPLEDMRWLEGLTAPTENGGYHLPMFQPGWLQGDIRVREFIFEAGLWTKLARSVPGNNLASKYTYSYFENGSDSGDIEFRILSTSPINTVFQVTNIVTQGPATYTNAAGNVIQQKRGIISTIAADGNEFTGIIKSIGGFTSITDGDITLESNSSITATITTVKIKRKDEVINVFGTEEQDAAYLLQDQSSININSEMFMRAVLTTFKYVIPSLVPQKEFTKRDYEQNLKFKDTDDISSYLNTTIKDALDNSEVFMNIGALISKRNQLFTESGAGVFLETDTDLTGADEGLLIDDIAEWWNDPTNDNDLSAPVQLNITSYTNSQIVHNDRVYQDIVDDNGNNVTIEGLVVGTLNSGNSILVGWRGAINTDTNTTLPSKPELDQLFRAGQIYTILDPYSSPQDKTQQTVAQITIST